MFYILFSLTAISCYNECGESTNHKTTISTNRIIVERGAFHYDSFVLDSAIIKFVPSKDGYTGKPSQYLVPSETKISSKSSKVFFKEIMDKGFFDLNDRYTSGTTDNSSLIITVEYEEQKKRVESEDFLRNCPPVMKFIENKMVKLHGKNLKRQILPV